MKKTLMKKMLSMGICILCAVTLYAPTARAVPMPLDGSWVTLEEWMSPGDYFADTYTWDSLSPVEFTITDIYVVTNIFEVYDFGSLIFTTPTLPDWDVLGLPGPKVSPPYTGDPDVALADGRFSSSVFTFAPGPHEITIRDIHIPPTSPGGDPFGTGTVAFKGASVPEPATILLIGTGLIGLMAFRRKLRKS